MCFVSFEICLLQCCAAMQAIPRTLGLMNALTWGFTYSRLALQSEAGPEDDDRGPAGLEQYYSDAVNDEYGLCRGRPSR